MHNSDVEELFELIQVGDAVELVVERTDDVIRIFDGTGAPTQVAQTPVISAGQ